MRTDKIQRAMIEPLESRRLLSAVIAPPNFIVFSPITVWPAEHGFEPEVMSFDLPIQYSLLNAPVGMTITSPTNSDWPMLAWTPTSSQTGSYNVTVVGTNSAGTLKVPFSIRVTPDVPELSDEVGSTYQPVQSETVGVPTQAQVVDSSGEKSVFSIVSAPAGVSINSSTGLINWTPTAAEAGNTKIIVQGKNVFGTSDLTIAFPTYPAPPVTNLVVKTDGLNAPTMSWTQPTNSLEKITGYYIQLQAFGPNGETTYNYDRSSSATSFKMQGLPKSDYEFIPTISPLDAAGHLGLATTGSAFRYATGVPMIDISESNIVALPQYPVSFMLTDSDSIDPATYKLISGPAGLTLDDSENDDISSAYAYVSWTPTDAQVGVQTAVFSATDALGTVTKTVTMTVQPPQTAASATAWVGDVTGNGFTLYWTPPTNAQFVAGYNIGIYYAIGTGSSNTNLYAGAKVSANVLSYHFTMPNLGAFAALISTFNSLDQSGGITQWISLGNSIYNPVSSIDSGPTAST
jgi:Putative Ig domain